MTVTRARGWAILSLTTGGPAGCGPDKAVESASVSLSATDPSSGTDSGGVPTGGDSTTLLMEGENTVLLAINRDVDVLFVVDNSGSMAGAQRTLARDIAALVDRLEGVDANYRIAITTTDSGNPRCPTSTPEGGNLVLSSCLDRADMGEFVTADEDFSTACTDVCTLRDSDLTVKPTTTANDDQAAPRRWVERLEGELNIDGVADAAGALKCYLPQGVAGCGFEAPLESMYLALAKSQDSQSKANYGFLREAAQLAVVVVSDETDCSYSPANKEIFTTNKVFWNSPDDPAPTSAMCWRAGIACTGGSPFSECHAENYDLAGGPGASDTEAVLQPVSKYIDFLAGIQDAKQNLDGDQHIKVALITGVPVGYDSFASELEYADSPDPQVQAAFGVGPGCVLDDPELGPRLAVPPVREREVAEAFQVEQDARSLYSICQSDFTAPLDAIGASIADDVKPTCFPNCVADTDPDTELLEPACKIYEDDPLGGTHTEIALCDAGADGWAVPAGQTVCWAARLDGAAKLTPSKLDDMSQACIDGGFNLEILLIRSAPAAPLAEISGACQLSPNKQQDCPNL